MWSLPNTAYCLGIYIWETFVFILHGTKRAGKSISCFISVKFFSDIIIKYRRILYKSTPLSLKNQTLGDNTSQKEGSSNLLLKLSQKGMLLLNKKPLVATITRARTHVHIKS